MDPMIATGQPAPDFSLPDLGGNSHSLSGQLGRLAILNFTSGECPWSERADRALVSFCQTWGHQVALLPVASNANEPPKLLARAAVERGLPFILVDADQLVADLYGAQTTPHLFLVDARGILRYQGGLDDVSFRRREPTEHYLLRAVEALLAGREPDPAETSPYGCTILRHAP